MLQLSPSAKELFQLGCVYSLTSSAENQDINISSALVEKAVSIQPKWLPVVMKDPDLQKLRESEHFRATVAQLRETAAREQLLRQESGRSPEQP